MQSTIRIDKYLAQLNLVSRREAKKFFRSGRVMVNGYVENDHGFHIVDGDVITIDIGDSDDL
jgi:16S rRNA U516 pseudouridylate synthase RsuA-like enzyme